MPFFLLCALPAVAQGAKKDTVASASGAERVQALKVSFITKRLDLTAEEAKKFWPIYDEYQDKRDVLRKQLQADYDTVRTQADHLSNEELTRLANEEMSLKQQDVALQAEMHEKLKNVLPPKKLAELYVAEDDFKKELVRILTEEKKSNGGNPK